MAINYNLINKGGISLSANFELLSEKPLDARHVVPTFEGLQNYIDNGAAYEGMIVYVSDQQVHYRVEATDGGLSYRELNWTDEELKALIASETVESFNAMAEAIATEKADRIVADNTITTLLNQETERSKTEDTHLSELIDSTATALTAAITQEKADRSAAITVLDTKLTQETQRATAEELRIGTALNQLSDALRTDLDLLSTTLETETTTRSTADSSLLTTINNEITSYNDLTDLPTIPTKTSDLNNDSDFVSAENLSEVAFTGSYNSLSDTPIIPDSTSDLTNDSDFITSQEVST